MHEKVTQIFVVPREPDLGFYSSDDGLAYFEVEIRFE
jgi:hypothetical protein